MATLDNLRRAKFSTIKAFALACGFSTSKASTVLQGRHANVMAPDEVRHIANILGVSFQEFTDAQAESYKQWSEKKIKPIEQEIDEPKRTRSIIDLIPLTNVRKA